MRKPERLAGLDLLRGIAALSVLTLHLPWPTAVQMPLPRAYLSVDLFFLLSGFVIAHAYSHRPGTAEEFKQYCLARVIRLYPLYLLAVVISVAEMLTYIWCGSSQNSNMTAEKVMSSFGTSIFLLPTPGRYSVEPTTFFPLVFTAWSLFWEFWVSLLYGVARVCLYRAVLALIIMVGAAGIGLAEYRYGVAGGTSWEGAWAGGARALFSFFAGVALFHFRERKPAPATPILLVAALLLVAFVPAAFGGWIYDVACIALLFPLILWLAAEAEMGRAVRKVGLCIGLLSYPVYLIQAPLLLWLAPLFVRLDRITPTGGVLELLIAVVAILLASWIFGRWFDRPARAWLSSRIEPHMRLLLAEWAP